VEYKVLNAADYRVPQKRERVIFIGTRFGVPILFPDPTNSEMGQATLQGGKTSKWVTVREAIDDLKDWPEDPDFGHLLTQHGGEFLDKIGHTPVGNSVFGDYSDSFYRNPPDEPSRTIKENHGGVLVHYEKNRVMTPRELARLQSFPDDFVFKGTKSNILVQIGNAVPPKLGQAIGNSIHKMLERIDGLDEKDSTRTKLS
jgi:DNA (cytosine-5)-methyltransferase 1